MELIPILLSSLLLSSGRCQFDANEGDDVAISVGAESENVDGHDNDGFIPPLDEMDLDELESMRYRDSSINPSSEMEDAEASKEAVQDVETEASEDRNYVGDRSEIVDHASDPSMEMSIDESAMADAYSVDEEIPTHPSHGKTKDLGDDAENDGYSTDSLHSIADTVDGTADDNVVVGNVGTADSNAVDDDGAVESDIVSDTNVVKNNVDNIGSVDSSVDDDVGALKNDVGDFVEVDNDIVGEVGTVDSDVVGNVGAFQGNVGASDSDVVGNVGALESHVEEEVSSLQSQIETLEAQKKQLEEHLEYYAKHESLLYKFLGGQMIEFVCVAIFVFVIMKISDILLMVVDILEVVVIPIVRTGPVYSMQSKKEVSLIF